MDNCFYLGIDGGATKTAYALADAGGTVLRSHRGLPCNPFDIGFDAACARLEEGIRAVCAEIPPARVSLFAGLSGGVTAGNREKFAEFFRAFGFFRAQNGSDMDNAVAAALGKGDGICAIVGTGSVICAVRHGEPRRYGGYGYYFDDTLSGFDLGRRAIAAALAAEDGTGPSTALSERLAALCGGPVRERLSPFYEKGKPYIASFAPAVFDAARAQDPVAARIVREQTEKLGAVLLAARRLYPDVFSVNVVLIGGLCAHGDVLRPFLAPFFPTDNLVFSRENQIAGALFLAGAPTERNRHA